MCTFGLLAFRLAVHNARTNRTHAEQTHPLTCRWHSLKHYYKRHKLVCKHAAADAAAAYRVDGLRMLCMYAFARMISRGEKKITINSTRTIQIES